MADIGRSTAAHIVEPGFVELENELLNWGQWQRCLPNPLKEGISVSPTFRAYISSYRDGLSERILPDDPDAAEELDALIASLEDKHVYCLVLNYVLGFSSRNAARTLCYLAEKENTKTKCSHQTYLRWLSDAVDRVGLLRIS